MIEYLTSIASFIQGRAKQMSDENKVPVPHSWERDDRSFNNQRAKHVKFTSQDSYYPSLEDRVSPKDQMTLMYKLAIHLCNDLSAYTKV